jgi:hypothetical protein
MDELMWSYEQRGPYHVIVFSDLRPLSKDAVAAIVAKGLEFCEDKDLNEMRYLGKYILAELDKEG